ncbi:MAG: BMP family protein [Candidatus Ranarchaeia archaeon]
MPQQQTEKVKYAFLLPGSITDSGWNAGMYLAAQKADDILDNIEVAITYGVGQVGVDDVYQEYLDQGYDVIWGHTIQFVDPANKFAKDYPDVYFVGSDYYYRDYANVIGMRGLMHEGSFITGMWAGALTNSGKCGYVGGFGYNTLKAYANAYFLGANLTYSAWAGDAVNVTVIWAGVWDDVDKGREAGQALLDAGVDVALGRGNGMTLGAIQAFDAVDGTYFFGDITDQSALAGNIVASNTLNFTVQILKFEEMREAGTLSNETPYWFGMAGGENVVVRNPAIPDSQLDYNLANISAWVDSMVTAIKNGNYTVPLIDNGTELWKL